MVGNLVEKATLLIQKAEPVVYELNRPGTDTIGDKVKALCLALIESSIFFWIKSWRFLTIFLTGL